MNLDPISLRYIERILAVAIGGLAIYLGYRLFLNMPEKTDSSGKVVLPGNISIYLSRVGPGAFFALFGACIVALSIYKGIIYTAGEDGSSKEKQQVPASVVASAEKQSEYFSGIVSQQQAGEKDLPFLRSSLRPKFRILNTLPRMMRPDLDPAERADVMNTSRQVKILLLKTVWGDDWGSFSSFESWLVDGGSSPAPEGLSEAVNLYQYGMP